MNPKYFRPGVACAAAHAAEEAGELVAMLGKLLRWGPLSVNPELPPEQQETNIAAVRREWFDLNAALQRLDDAIEIEGIENADT